MLRRVAYWLAVLIVSLALVVALILFFEARDQSQVERSARDGGPASVALTYRPSS